jgi:hypothetical protein
MAGYGDLSHSVITFPTYIVEHLETQSTVSRKKEKNKMMLVFFYSIEN